jgi:hypothetical protein
MSTAKEILELKKQLDSGLITQEEFEEQKGRMMSDNGSTDNRSYSPPVSLKPPVISNKGLESGLKYVSKLKFIFIIIVAVVVFFGALSSVYVLGIAPTTALISCGAVLIVIFINWYFLSIISAAVEHHEAHTRQLDTIIQELRKQNAESEVNT